MLDCRAWLFVLVAGGLVSTVNAQQDVSDALRKDEAVATTVSKLVRIKVQGNRFVDDGGQPIVFRGLAIADPEKIVRDGHWNKQHFETISSWGANLVRIPIHPGRYRKSGQAQYLKWLQQAVSWCTELEMYVIIDWHGIGNLRTEKFESEDYRTSMRETLEFWRAVSKQFAEQPTVAFYEIFNEPTEKFGDFGRCSWSQWKPLVEQIIDAIRENDPQTIPLVAGFDWAYDLRDVGRLPIDRPGVAYAVHPYPGKCAPPRERSWDERFGFLAQRYPIVASEMGYYLKGDFQYMIDDGSYRKAILRYLGRKRISWCIWVFDPDWAPPLIKDYDYRPTHCGRFFREAMQASTDRQRD